MKFYHARLRRHYPCGAKKFLDYYFKHESLVEARKKVRKRYKGWRIVHVKAIGDCLPVC